jgi:hypothetical protein
MAAPKGNKNSKGHGIGAPQKYTDAFILKEADALKVWLKDTNNVYLKEFAFIRGYTHQRLTEFAKKSIIFSDALERAKDCQEIRLVKGGLNNIFNSSICKFVLQNCHNWRDKQEVAGDAANPLSLLLQNVDGNSKELASNDG